jgi:hypothetical protein
MPQPQPLAGASGGSALRAEQPVEVSRLADGPLHQAQAHGVAMLERVLPGQIGVVAFGIERIPDRSTLLGLHDRIDLGPGFDIVRGDVGPKP